MMKCLDVLEKLCWVASVFAAIGVALLLAFWHQIFPWQLRLAERQFNLGIERVAAQVGAEGRIHLKDLTDFKWSRCSGRHENRP